jgi:hypothetical protein
MKTKNILLSMVVLMGSLSWGGASASSSSGEMRAYYVDPGSSTDQAGKIIAILTNRQNSNNKNSLSLLLIQALLSRAL